MLLLYCRTIAPIVVYVYISLFFYYDIRVLVISKITTEVSDQLALTALRYDILQIKHVTRGEQNWSENTGRKVLK